MSTVVTSIHWVLLNLPAKQESMWLIYLIKAHRIQTWLLLFQIVCFSSLFGQLSTFQNVQAEVGMFATHSEVAFPPSGLWLG